MAIAIHVSWKKPRSLSRQTQGQFSILDYLRFVRKDIINLFSTQPHFQVFRLLSTKLEEFINYFQKLYFNQQLAARSPKPLSCCTTDCAYKKCVAESVKVKNA